MLYYRKTITKCYILQQCGCISKTQKGNFSLKTKKLPFLINVTVKNMNSVNSSNWKLLSQLKDYLSKTSSVSSSSNSSHNKNVKNVTIFELSKEWINFLQKYSSFSMFGMHFQNIISNASEALSIENNKTKNDNNSGITNQKITKPIPISKQNIIDDLKQHENVKKWKTQSVSKTTMLSATQHVLSSIVSAETIPSKLKRIEELIDHMNKHPDGRIYSVKEGAIKILLRVREKHKDEALHQVIREALAILGYCDPLPGKGIRILSIDGGGVRGIAVLELLRKLEELSGKRISEMFDYICGVSTGSIVLSTIGTPEGAPMDDVLALYKNLSTKLFTQSRVRGTWDLVFSHAYYDTNMFEELMKEYVGEMPMIETNRMQNCPKFSIVSTLINKYKALPYVFRNYTIPYQMSSQYDGSHKYKLWQAVRASGAAPTYFGEYHLDGLVHQDGGIVANNPTAIAIHEASLLWPNEPIQCVVSCGTGRITPIKQERQFHEKIETTKTSASSWKDKFLRILDSATDTEGVHTLLSDCLPQGVYYRFNPYLSDVVDMDEIKPEKLLQLQLDTAIYIRKNEQKFGNAVKQLTAEKSPAQKISDYVKFKSFMLKANL